MSVEPLAMCLSCRKKGRLRRPLLKKDALLGIVDPGGDSLEIPRDSLRLLASVPQIRLTLDDTEERLVYDHPSPEDDIVLTSVQNLEQLQKSVLPLGFAFMFPLVEGPREPYPASRRCTGFVRKAIIFSNESFKSTRFVRGTCFFSCFACTWQAGSRACTAKHKPSGCVYLGV